MADDVTRRGFLAGLTAGGAALAADTAHAEAVVQAVNPRVELARAGGPLKVLVAAKLTSDELERIRRAGRDVDLIVPQSAAEMRAGAEDAEVILGEPSVETILSAKKLKWVQ